MARELLERANALHNRSVALKKQLDELHMVYSCAPAGISGRGAFFAKQRRKNQEIVYGSDERSKKRIFIPLPKCGSPDGSSPSAIGRSKRVFQQLI